MPNQADKLIVSGLSKAYDSPEGPVAILKDISFEVEPGRTLAIVGPSGSGKSTLLNIIGTLDRPTGGTVRLGELEITALAGAALADFRAHRVGFVFQEHHLLPQLTALENVMLPGLAGGGHGDPIAAAELLERMGVSRRAKAFPAQMSGGERQRVAIARALVNGASLLLCDEPTGNLDADTGSRIADLFLDLAHSNGVTVLMVTHNLQLAGRFDRCMVLRDGALTLRPAAATSGGAL